MAASREEEFFYEIEKLVGKLVTVILPDTANIRGILERSGNKFSISFYHYSQEEEETFSVTIKFDEDDVYKIDSGFIYIFGGN